MSTRISVSFFGTGSVAGLALQQAVIALVEGEYHFLMKRSTSVYEQIDIARACLEDDIVIFDASIEPGNLHNYDAAVGHLIYMDHALVVSRTYLPLNFSGIREGGAPSYPNPYTASDGTFSNEQILSWLREQIAALLPALPRSEREKGVLRSLGVIRASTDLQDQYRNARGQIFISYRSSGLKKLGNQTEQTTRRPLIEEDPDELDRVGVQQVLNRLNELKREIEVGTYTNGEPHSVRFILPGELAYANELLTEMRRWQVLTIIDRYMGAADEVWIYRTDDYLQSWWTQGEIVTMSYRREAGTKNPKIRIFDYASRTVINAPPLYLPSMTRAERKRMARWYANTDPWEIGPEGIVPMRIYASLPLIGRLKYLQDHVWSEEFWEYPRLPCSDATLSGVARPFSVNDFLWIKDHTLTPAHLQEAIKHGEVVCPFCRTAYQLRQLPPRYLWYPRRMGKVTGPEGLPLQALPTYQAILAD